MSDTLFSPLHSAGFPGYCSLMDLNGCVVTCMRFPLLFEPTKLYHHTPADDLLQAVNSIVQHNIRWRNFFFVHFFPQIVHVGGLETEAIITNKCVPLRYVLVSRLLWFCGFKWLVCVSSQICIVRYMRRLSFFAMLKFKI